MKCVQNIETFEVKRLSDKEADLFVETGRWTYINKEVWKANLNVSAETRKRRASKGARE